MSMTPEERAELEATKALASAAHHLVAIALHSLVERGIVTSAQMREAVDAAIYIVGAAPLKGEAPEPSRRVAQELLEEFSQTLSG